MPRFLTALLVAMGMAALAAQDPVDRGGIFTCGEDQKLSAPITLHWSTIVLAGDGRLYVPCPASKGSPTAPHPISDREVREAALLRAANLSKDFDQRWRAAQAEARLGASVGILTRNATVIPACSAQNQYFQEYHDGFIGNYFWHPGPLFMMLLDANPVIRQEGAYGIGVQLAKPDLNPHLVTAATVEYQACIRAASLPTPQTRPLPQRSLGNLAQDAEVTGLLLEAAGHINYPSDAEHHTVEELLAASAKGPDATVLGAVRGLEALIRLNPSRELSPDSPARLRLRQLVSYGGKNTETSDFDTASSIRRVALIALQGAHDHDLFTVQRASTDADWQVRRLVAGSLNLADPNQADLAEQLEKDRAFQVRYELLAPMSRLATQTKICAPLIERFKDPELAIAMRAMDLLISTCTDLEPAIVILSDHVRELDKIEAAKRWYLPSRALAALARVSPDDAKPYVAAAVKHSVWQVRAAAAGVALTLGDESAAITLARDPEPNVRTAALETLARMKSAAVVPEAIHALKTGADYQLLKTAAFVLRGLPEEAKTEATAALLGALARLTDEQTDTSREPRVGILDRLGETMPPAQSTDLLPYTTDYDDKVIDAAVTTFTTLVGVPPAIHPLRRRYPFQPSLDALNSLPKQAEIQLEAGIVTLSFLTDVAPVTVARFAALASQGYYNNKTFHHVVPNFFVQGGSPGANDYSGAQRFLREEIGPQGRHLRGAVGMSTRGGDTGDGQFFIDLVDLPRFDREYTVFALVTGGMELVDRLLDGAKIVSVSVK